MKKKVFGCPKCGSRYEAYPPDDLHPNASIEEPKDADVSGTVFKSTYDCNNPLCKHPIVVYWYMPSRSFERA